MLRHAKIQGLIGEKKAAAFLIENGYSVLAERWKIRGGEIDIIVSKEKTIVFVEVKKRKSLNSALMAISPRQIRRITFAALQFLERHPEISWDSMRFDAICVPDVGPLQHLQNITMDFDLEL